MGQYEIVDQTVHECQHRSKARSVAWNSDGYKLASGSIDKLAKIWSIEGPGTGKELTTLAGHQGTVERVRWHPTDPTILSTASVDQSILIWDIRVPTNSSSSSICMDYVAKIELKYQPSKHAGHSNFGPASIEWHPKGNILAITEKDNSVHLYDVRNLSRQKKQIFTVPIQTHCLQPNILQETHFDHSGNHLVSATKSPAGLGTIKVWNAMETTSKHMNLAGHTGSCFCLRLSPSGHRMATGGADALVGLWDTSEMVCTSTINRHDKFIRSLSFSHDDLFLASSSEEPFIDVAHAETGDKVGEIQAKCGADEVTWNPKFHALAYASGEVSTSHSMMHSRNNDRLSHNVSVVKLKFKHFASF